MPTIAALAVAASLLGPIPPGYYATVDASTPATLRATLHNVIKDHTRYPYSSGGTDTWIILEQADEDPNDSTHVLDVYLNDSILKFGGGTGPYNREHTWPNSYGFSVDNSTNYPYTDCHALFLSDPGYNSTRGNDPYGNCDATCAEKQTMGGTTGIYPGLSNWRKTNLWETWIGRRGDVARAQFYMDVRYEGGNHAGNNAPEPNLILTDDEGLIQVTGGNAPVAYHGRLSALLQWTVQDPVDAKEQHRNDVVYGYQGNRNPFIDHPEWVACLFQGVCSGSGVTADLSITLTDGVTTAVPGAMGGVTYTIVASNAGPDPVTGATVTDDFPPSLTCAWSCAASPGSSCGAGGSGDMADPVSLLASGTATYTANCQIASSATGSLVNAASVTAPSGTTDAAGNNTASDTDTLTPQADLAISKTDGATSEIPGTTVQYAVVASNSGPSDNPSVNVADILTAPLTGCSWTTSTTGGASGNDNGAGTAIADSISLPTASSVTYSVSCSIAPAATGSLVNTATVATGGAVTDPSTTNNSATDTDALDAQADLAITVSDGAATEVPGTGVTYTLVVSNLGPSSEPSATVAATWPAALSACTWSSIGAGGATGNDSGAGNLSDSGVVLPPGASVTYTAACTVAPGATGSLSTTATVTSAIDPATANNAATDADTLTPQADLGITKTDGVTQVAAGGTLTYTIVASNPGPSDAPGSTVSDTPPAGCASFTWTCLGAGGGSCSASGSGAIGAIVGLPVGSSVTYTASCGVAGGASGSIQNTASVAPGAGVAELAAGDNTATDTDAIAATVLFADGFEGGTTGSWAVTQP